VKRAGIKLCQDKLQIKGKCWHDFQAKSRWYDFWHDFWHDLVNSTPVLTVLLCDRSLQPEQALVQIDLDVSLADEAEHKVVGEARVGRLHLGQRGAEGLRGGNVAVLELKRENGAVRNRSIVYFFLATSYNKKF
jgi:hypothetical protein